jgi:glycerol-3-phosphate cytidylyltransferase
MIGFTAGCFDLLHAGHVMMLEEAKSVCDYLIVGLHVDPSIERSNKNKPVQSLIERQLQLSAIKYVDQVVVYSTEEELKELLFAYEVDIRIIGEEYEGYQYTGKGFTQYVHYNKRNHGYSTTELRKRCCIS